MLEIAPANALRKRKMLVLPLPLSFWNNAVQDLLGGTNNVGVHRVYGVGPLLWVLELEQEGLTWAVRPPEG